MFFHVEGRGVRWQQKGACYGLYEILGEDLWFPQENIGGPRTGRGVRGQQDRFAQAKRLCERCEVRAECLQFAIDEEMTGLWGGMTERERRELLKQQRTPGTTVSPG